VNTIEAHAVWRLDAHVRFRRMFDEGVVIHQDRAEALVLNDTGMAFLELCDGQRKMAEIVGQISARYAIGTDTLMADLLPFVQELAADGIIHRVEAVSA
jgi:hypothetical protein